MHSLRKHRQQLAAWATLWKLLSTCDREHKLSFLLLFVFSLRKEVKRNVNETRLYNGNKCSAREKWVLRNKNCERSFLNKCCFVLCRTQFFPSPARIAHKFPHFEPFSDFYFFKYDFLFKNGKAMGALYLVALANRHIAQDKKEMLPREKLSWWLSLMLGKIQLCKRHLLTE